MAKRLYLREIREERGMTQEDLAQEADCTQAYISVLEHGKHKPSREMLARLADALGCRVCELMREEA